MPRPCPRCEGRNCLYVDEDVFGSWVACRICGFAKLVTLPSIYVQAPVTVEQIDEQVAA